MQAVRSRHADGSSDVGDAGTDGIDAAAVTAWLAERRPALRPPLDFDAIAGGRSNLTYTVTDEAGARYVLRRPPLHSVLESAHTFVFL